jgi:hypothetical protein
VGNFRRRRLGIQDDRKSLSSRRQQTGCGAAGALIPFLLLSRQPAVVRDTSPRPRDASNSAESFSSAEVAVFADGHGVPGSAIFTYRIGRLQTFCRPFSLRHLAPVGCRHVCHATAQFCGVSAWAAVTNNTASPAVAICSRIIGPGPNRGRLTRMNARPQVLPALARHLNVPPSAWFPQPAFRRACRTGAPSRAIRSCVLCLFPPCDFAHLCREV